MPKKIKIKIEKAVTMAPYKTADGTIVFFVLDNRKVVHKLNSGKGERKHVIEYLNEKDLIRLIIESDRPPFLVHIYCYRDHLKPAVVPEAKAVVFVDENFIKNGDVEAKGIAKLKMYNLTNEFRIALKKVKEVLKKENETNTTGDTETGSEESSSLQSSESYGHPSSSTDIESNSSGDGSSTEERTDG